MGLKRSNLSENVKRGIYLGDAFVGPHWVNCPSVRLATGLRSGFRTAQSCEFPGG